MIAASKSDLRRAALARRAALPQAIRARFADRILQEGLRLAERHKPRSVSAFYPVREEPDALALLAALAESGVATALPATGAPGEPLVFRRWRPGDPTAPAKLRIPEPPADAEALEPDLLFVPLAAFDRRGHRIGYGAGFYDRTLARLKALKPVVAVGLAYAVSEVDAVPDEAHDEALDYILTDAELIAIRGR